MYLGKTIQNPYKYKGSGDRWLNHLNFHNVKNKEIKTYILFQSTNINNIKELGLYYSKLWNIVKSKEFANLIDECGQGFPAGRKLSKDHIEKLRNSKLGIKRKPMSDETKNKLRLANIGKKYSLHRKLSEETKIKISNSLKGKKQTLETIEKRSNKRRKKVYQYDKEMNLIKIWKCAKDAALELELHTSNICNCCIKKIKSTGNFIWSYKNNEKEDLWTIE